jgi:hypothetical protein
MLFHEGMPHVRIRSSSLDSRSLDEVLDPFITMSVPTHFTQPSNHIIQVKFTKVDIDNKALQGVVEGHRITGVVRRGSGREGLLQ